MLKEGQKVIVKGVDRTSIIEHRYGEATILGHQNLGYYAVQFQNGKKDVVHIGNIEVIS